MKFSPKSLGKFSLFQLRNIIWAIILVLPLTLILDSVIMPNIARAGAERIKTPDVVGKTKAEAAKVLEQTGFRIYWHPEARYDTLVPEGHVLIQNIVPGREVKLHREITLTLSKGIPQVVVPRLHGKSQADARGRLTRMKLVVGKNVDSYFPEMNNKQVIRTIPEEGELMREGDTIRLVVSTRRPANSRNMPDFSREKSPNSNKILLPQVKKKIESMGLKVDTVYYLSNTQYDSLQMIRKGTIEKPSDLLPGTVVFQQPMAYEIIAPSQGIRLWVIK